MFTHLLQKSLNRNKPKTQLAVFLCLFAVLIIYFGPLFSQINNARISSNSEQSKHIGRSAMIDHSSMVHHQSTQLNIKHGHNHHYKNDCSEVLEACSYCSLLFHLNWLDVQAFRLHNITQNHYPDTVVTIFTIEHYHFFTPLLPRAPPQKQSQFI